MPLQHELNNGSKSVREQWTSRLLCGELGCHWPLRCHGIGQSLPARHRNGVSIVTTCSRAVKAGCEASFFRFYKRKQGIKTVKSSLQGTTLLFSPWGYINDRYIGEDAWNRKSNRPWSSRYIEIVAAELTTQTGGFWRILYNLSATERHFSWLYAHLMS